MEYVVDGNFDVQFEDGWVHSDDFAEIKARIGFEAFAAYGLRVGSQYDQVVDQIMERLIAERAIATKGDEYSGQWFRLSVPKKLEIARKIIDENPASRLLAGLPEAALENAIDQIAKEDKLPELYVADTDGAAELDDLVAQELIPASDRMVSLSHNQISELEQDSTKLIDAVEDLNSIDGDTGLRATVIGGLKAGRELIRAGAFKLYALEVTLVEALKFLVKRYEREAIGALAAVLLAALATHLGIPN
jgi:hypothetical protein